MKKQPAFTLIEMAIAIMVVGLLMALFIQILNQASQASLIGQAVTELETEANFSLEKICDPLSQIEFLTAAPWGDTISPTGLATKLSFTLKGKAYAFYLQDTALVMQQDQISAILFNQASDLSFNFFDIHGQATSDPKQVRYIRVAFRLYTQDFKEEYSTLCALRISS